MSHLKSKNIHHRIIPPKSRSVNRKTQKRTEKQGTKTLTICKLLVLGRTDAKFSIYRSQKKEYNRMIECFFDFI